MKILLADDHEVVRRGLKQLLSEELEGVSFLETGTAAETIACATQNSWDLMILDINMPGRSGLDVLSALAARKIENPVLVLSMASEQEYAVRVLKKGARGFVNKQTVVTDLVAAVRAVLAGRRYISAEVADHLAMGLNAPSERPLHEKLSDREIEVLRLIASGMTVKEIATELTLSEKTVFTYRDRLRSKLGLKGDVELARYAIQHGLVD